MSLLKCAELGTKKVRFRARVIEGRGWLVPRRSSSREARVGWKKGFGVEGEALGVVVGCGSVVSWRRWCWRRAGSSTVAAVVSERERARRRKREGGRSDPRFRSQK